MIIQLYPSSTLEDIKNRFVELFPYLKIEFFSKNHGEEKGSHSRFMIFDVKKTLASLGLAEKHFYEIYPETTAAQFEQDFQNNFYLPIQVFRKTGGTWLATIETDSWTLEHLNRSAYEQSSIVSNMDFDNTIFDTE